VLTESFVDFAAVEEHDCPGVGHLVELLEHAFALVDEGHVVVLHDFVVHDVDDPEAVVLLVRVHPEAELLQLVLELEGLALELLKHVEVVTFAQGAASAVFDVEPILGEADQNCDVERREDVGLFHVDLDLSTGR